MTSSSSFIAVGSSTGTYWPMNEITSLVKDDSQSSRRASFAHSSPVSNISTYIFFHVSKQGFDFNEIVRVTLGIEWAKCAAGYPFLAKRLAVCGELSMEISKRF